MTFDIIVSASTLQDYVDSMTSIVDETTLHFREDELWTNAVDPANVAMIAQTLHADACEHYESHGVKIGVNLSRLDDYLGKADSDDLVHLTFDEEKRKINIEYGDVFVKMAGIDPDSIRDGQTLPENAVEMLSTDVTMDGAAFNHAIDVAGMVSDHVLLDSDPDREEPLHVVGEGDTDDARIKFSSALDGGSEIPEACESLFSEDYLDDLTGVIPKTAAVRIQHGHECPMRLTYEYPDAHVDVEIGLAPRIQAD
jgi:proliferating cell nuclear antigen